jgi:hypothetical protein
MVGPITRLCYKIFDCSMFFIAKNAQVKVIFLQRPSWEALRTVIP